MGVKASVKQTEVGVIPEDWLDPQLQEITEEGSPICYGIVQVGGFTANGIPVLAIKNLNLDYASNIHRAAVDIERPYARSRIQPNDILISVKGTTGRVGIVPSHFRGNISRDLARIRLRKEIAPGYIFQILQSELAQRRFVGAAVGTTRMELSIAILKQVRVPLPPTKAEQEAIAEALSDTDALSESLEQLLAKKRHLKQGAMQQLLTGKKRLPGFEINPGFKRTEIGMIPEDWEVKPLDSVAFVTSGKRLPLGYSLTQLSQLEKKSE
jgi:type I restriction enzyme S subunit